MNGSRRTQAGLILAALLAAGFLAIGTILMLRPEVPANRPALLMLHWFGVRDAFLGFFLAVLLVSKEYRAVRLFVLCTLLLPIADTFILAPFWGMAASVRFNLSYEMVIGIVWVLLSEGRPGKMILK